MNIVKMSLQGALMIAVIVIVRALGMGKLPKWSFQALWGIAIARLLIPFQIESMLSVYGAIDRVRYVQKPAPQVTQAVANTTSYAAALSAPVIAGNAAAAPPITPWLALWFAGAVLLLGFFLLKHLRCRRTYAQALPLSRLKVNGMDVAVRVSDRITAPLTYGIAKPVVLLPKRLNADAHSYVLAHELMHIRHFDTLKKWLLTFTLCAHWFNPMVWVMFILATRDIELLCDESVVRGFGDGAKASYATMLIDLMEERGGFAPLANHFSRNAIEERILAIMKHKKASRAAIITAAALVITTATALSTSAVTPSIEAGADLGTTHIVEDKSEAPNLVGTSMDDIEWWTADEYEAWLNEQREELPKIIGERAYTAARGWFVWTREDVDDALAMYESILNGIKNGTRISKTVAGRDDIVLASDAAPVAEAKETSFGISGDANASGVEQGYSGSLTLGDYSRSAWKMDYNELTLHSETWRGRVFLCDGVVTEVINNAQGQTVIMDVNLSGEGDPQYVVLDNYSSLVTPNIGERYTAYADVTGNQLYNSKHCPKLACRFMLKA